jgi:FMN-dependent NADH-azoreductase
MIFQEALEYLNLPANPSEQLTQKRYLELKKDYQNAINNAPSDHFRDLYQENLDKIKEAYMLLMDQQEANHESDSEIQQSIQQVQQIVDTFLEGQSEGDINPEARAKIKNFIDQISSFQDNLRKESPKK